MPANYRVYSGFGNGTGYCKRLQRHALPIYFCFYACHDSIVNVDTMHAMIMPLSEAKVTVEPRAGRGKHRHVQRD